MRDQEASTSKVQRPRQVTFDELYQREGAAYGTAPSPELVAFFDQCPLMGEALDLGAGHGRDALALARRGLTVTAIDSSSEGIARLRKAAEEEGLGERIDAQVRDVRDLQWSTNAYRAIVAATVLDHLPREDLDAVWNAMVSALSCPGMLFVEVHTTEDPASPVGAGAASDAPISESAVHVKHYFRPNELLTLVWPRLRVCRYEERREWDQTHGAPHKHGKASLIAVPRDGRPPFYGLPLREG